MFHAIIIEKQEESCRILTASLRRLYPHINIIGIGRSERDCRTLFRDLRVEIIFIDPQVITSKSVKEIKRLGVGKAFVCISNTTKFADVAAYWHSVGYLLKPVEDKGLMTAVESALIKIERQREIIRNEKMLDLVLHQKHITDLIGIPTIEGYQILLVQHIVRCEGLQKCTRIITAAEKNLVSSYNIGEFKRLLSRYNYFFSPHRSHLINMQFVKQFRKSGQAVMEDGTHVPIAKSKKEEFLSYIAHL